MGASADTARTADMARVVVDCRQWAGPLRRIWTSFGYDELNWTATPRGQRNLATMHTIMEAVVATNAIRSLSTRPVTGMTRLGEVVSWIHILAQPLARVTRVYHVKDGGAVARDAVQGIGAHHSHSYSR
jgi:hypothetical protein